MLSFVSVTKKFGNGDVALKDVSFHLDSGDFVIVAGPSGSGKTTLMNLLIKDLVPSEGEVIYKDAVINNLPASQLPAHRRKIGVVFQDYRLLPELNVWENIALPLSIIGKPTAEIESRVTDLLNLVSLTEKALMFPKQLSGGEAQRVSIARALATGPSLIFADEPTGNLDRESSLAIIKLLKQINKLGTTIILATHDVVVLDDLAKERIIKLDKGVLKSDSAPKQVAQKDSPKLAEKTPAKPSPQKIDKKENKQPVNKDKRKPEHTEDQDLIEDFIKQPDQTKKPADENKPKKFGFSLPFFKKTSKADKEEKKS
ncbi:MAG: ATP-binding cassette domain-containing protein [Patescibacteria group bacterium]